MCVCVSWSEDDPTKSKYEKESMSMTPCHSIVGRLMYATIATRLDIVFMVGVVSRYKSNPSGKHYEAVKFILRYLSGINDKCL